MLKAIKENLKIRISLLVHVPEQLKGQYSQIDLQIQCNSYQYFSRLIHKLII